MAAVSDSLTVIDPAGLGLAQRAGDACCLCGKRWPRPRVFYGSFPDGSPALVCDDHDVEAR